MKGLVLAGGTGSRLSPATRGVSKQLLPIFDKPMVFYPLVTLMQAGIRDIAIITLPHEQHLFTRLVGDGSHLGLSISYLAQETPRGLADAFLVSEAYLGGQDSCLILGDNLFFGKSFESVLRSGVQPFGALVFGQKVSNPNQYGVAEVETHSRRVVSLEEKPSHPKSSTAITGIYFVDGTASERARGLNPSERGELEIIDLLKSYWHDDQLELEALPEGTVWMDTGSFESLLDASSLIRLSQARFGTLIGSPELAAWELGYISDQELDQLGDRHLNSAYGKTIKDLIRMAS